MSAPIARAAAIGAASGLVWGITARCWMRLISTQPEFSWSGTLMIIAFSAWLGLFVGLIYGTRMARKRRWLILFGLPGVMLFLSPGMLFVPAFVLGSAIWNHAQQRSVRRLGVAAGWLAVLLPTLLLWNDVRYDEHWGVHAPLLDQAQVALGFGFLSLALAYGASFMWRPRPIGPTPDQSSATERAEPELGEVELLGADGGVVAMSGVDDGVVRQREQ